MADEGDNKAPVVVKKKRKAGGHDDHHGGAWKVAYADFVTAMMAFFLLLWLLNATTEEQKLGIADYFSPENVTKATSGGGGMLQGQTLSTEGAMTDNRATIGVTVSRAETHDRQDNAPREAEETGEAAGGGRAAGAPHEMSQSALNAAVARHEEARFAAAEARLRQAIRDVPDLKALSRNLIVDRTPEGMRIQIVDHEGTSMFPLGSAEMHGRTRRLLARVAEAVARLPNKVAIKGHTDAKPFHGAGDYTNWELSSDRANASRRALVAAGLDPERLAYVVGRAAQDPLVPDKPASPRNRRISIVLLHEDGTRPFATDGGEAEEEARSEADTGDGGPPG